jgi:hypothetical protein
MYAIIIDIVGISSDNVMSVSKRPSPKDSVLICIECHSNILIFMFFWVFLSLQ